MKKLAIITAFLFCLIQIEAAAQKNEKSKLTYDSTAKVLTRSRFIEVEEVIDTARLYQERARLLAEKEKVEAQLDSNNVQIKEARRLMRGGKKGNGNSRTAEAPPIQIALAPPCDSIYTFEKGPVTVCLYKGVIQRVSQETPYMPEKPKTTKPKSKAKKSNE